MGQKCAICSSSRRVAVDQALAQGASIRQVAARFGFGRNMVHSHSRHAELAAAHAEGSPCAIDRRALRSWTRILRRAERKGDIAAMARAQEALDAIHARSSQPRRQHGRPENVVLRVVYDEPPPLQVEDKRRIIDVLQRIVQRPEASAAVVAAATRLAALLQGKVLPPAVEAAIAEIEKKIDEVPGAIGFLADKKKKLEAEPPAPAPSELPEQQSSGSNATNFTKSCRSGR